MHFGVKKLTSDMFSQIINNYYMRPSYKQPYFFINNVNTSNVFPTDNNQVSIFKYKIRIDCSNVNMWSTITVNDDTSTIPSITFTLSDE